MGPLDGFRSKLGRPFSAMLVIGDDFKVSMAWDQATNADGSVGAIQFINEKSLGRHLDKVSVSLYTCDMFKPISERIEQLAAIYPEKIA